MPDKTILITGAAGFIGRHVTSPLLARGYTVHAVARGPRNTGDGVVWHQSDLLWPDDRARLIESVKPQVLLHLAWYTEHGKFWSAPENALWQGASLDLFSRAAASGTRRIIGVGSCAEYDWNRTDRIPWKESDPCHPHTPYGKAKLATLAALESLGVEFAWGRIFHLFGAGEHPARLIPSIIHALAENEQAKCTSGRQTRDFMDVRDVGAALAALVDSTATGAVNVASGSAVTIAEIALLIGRMMRKPELVALGALPDRPDDPPYIVADTRKLREEARFAGVQRLEDGLERMINEFLAASRPHDG
jgi:nucleoside-diphosphate-sugar epimerase